MGLLKNGCKAILVVLVAVMVICVVRTFVLINFTHKRLTSCSKSEGDEFIDLSNRRWQLLRHSIQIKTISRDDGRSEYKELERIVKFIIDAHPIVFKSSLVSYEIVNGYSLLIHVKGTDDKLLPYALAAHLDVVPVIESQWSVNPFNATEDEARTKLYGRGALDNKNSVMAHLAALEILLKRGTRPKRSFYLAYGHDEEVLGHQGAGYIAKTLKARGVDRLYFVLDEGMFVARKTIPGLDADTAVIGVTEKGFMNINVSVEFSGGHSSVPGKETAVGILSGAIARLQANPMPGKLDDLVTELLITLIPEVNFPLNIVFSNLWLFKPVVLWVLERNKNMQGIVRTTTAATVLRAGEKFNVVPSSAWAIVNHRVHPLDTFEKVVEYDRKIINDERVKVTPFDHISPHPISPYDRTSSLAYQVLTDTVEQIFENALVAPATMVATTDTKHYLEFTENIYRFNPMILTPKDIATIHAEDEAINKDNFQRMINFYYHLMQNADRVELRQLTESKEEL